MNPKNLLPSRSVGRKQKDEQWAKKVGATCFNSIVPENLKGKRPKELNILIP